MHNAPRRTTDVMSSPQHTHAFAADTLPATPSMPAVAVQSSAPPGTPPSTPDPKLTPSPSHVPVPTSINGAKQSGAAIGRTCGGDANEVSAKTKTTPSEPSPAPEKVPDPSELLGRLLASGIGTPKASEDAAEAAAAAAAPSSNHG